MKTVSADTTSNAGPGDPLTEQTLFRFIDFYLSPMLAQKSIDLMKLRLERRLKNLKDPLLRDVQLIRRTMDLLSVRRKILITVFHPRTQIEKTYLEILRIEPSDCLILTSENLFKIPKAALSIALKTSEESIDFRRKQLQSIFDEEGVTLAEISKLVAANRSAESQVIPEKLDLIRRFQRLPLALRFMIESGTVLMALLALLWVIPEIRNRYENSIQRRINDYLIESSLVDSPPPAGLNAQASAPAKEASEDAPGEAEDDAPVTKSSSDAVTSRKQPRVNEGETWRFSFTGSATSDIESAASLAVQKLNIDLPKPVTVPGGIQFDFAAPVDQVIPLKAALEQKTLEIQSKAAGGADSVANFSWYKKRNMGTRKIPAGHVQIFIWISTL